MTLTPLTRPSRNLARAFTCAVAWGAGAWAVSGEPLAAQSDLTVEIGGSQIGPPVGIEGEHARFLMGGLRGSHYRTSGSGGFASLLFGHTLDDAVGGSFLSGVLEGSLTNRRGPNWSLGLAARVMGYGTQKPYPYRAFAAEWGPSIRVRTTNFGWSARALGGAGLSQLKLLRELDGASRLFETDLWRYGGSTAVQIGPVTSNVGLAGGWHRTPAGDYANAGLRFALAGRWGFAEVRVDRWDTPTATETTGGLAVVVPFGGWSLRSFFGRTDPDPLTLAQPGSGGGGFLVGRSMFPVSAGDPADDFSTAPYQIVEYGEARSRVLLRVTPPAGTTSMVVVGDFNLWEAAEMQQQSDGSWTIEIDVPAGTHHFGYLADEEWFIPDDAPDVVPDEWGRLNATLVIEGGSK